MTDKGIDYGMGTTNIDRATGIRFGVIHSGEVCQAWADSSEADYGAASCPKCGNEAKQGDSDHADDDYCLACKHNHGKAWGGQGEPHKDARCHDCHCTEPDWANDHDRDDMGYETLHHACGDYACDDCRILFDGEDAYGEEPLAWTLDDGEYQATQSGSDCDVFILRSPYYTRARFCSPCAPGACYLMNPTDDGEKAYCFGHDWFEDGKAPYPVYRVSDDTLANPE